MVCLMISMMKSSRLVTRFLSSCNFRLFLSPLLLLLLHQFVADDLPLVNYSICQLFYFFFFNHYFALTQETIGLVFFTWSDRPLPRPKRPPHFFQMHQNLMRSRAVLTSRNLLKLKSLRFQSCLICKLQPVGSQQKYCLYILILVHVCIHYSRYIKLNCQW